MLKNIVEPGRTHEKYGACAMHAAHSRLQAHIKDMEYFCFSPAAVVARTRLLMFCYTYVVCLVYFPLSLFMRLIFLGKHDIHLSVVGNRFREI